MDARKRYNRKGFTGPGRYADVSGGPARAGNMERPMVGVAWHNHPAETYQATCRAIETAGGIPVPLDQVFSAGLAYDNEGKLLEGVDGHGMLSREAAQLVRSLGWKQSNAALAMHGLRAVVFPGGSDVCPSLYAEPREPETLEGFSAERDVSDYLLMSWCLEHDIPILAICRGMQMLGVVHGAQIIQDIPAYMERCGKKHAHEHRNEPPAPGAYRDFAFHDVRVTDAHSLLFRETGMPVIRNVPSWHHQALKSVEGTGLKVTGVLETSGVNMIEAVERTGRTFVLGVQFHPEIAVVRGLDDLSLVYFSAIVREATAQRHGSGMLQDQYPLPGEEEIGKT